MLAPDLNQLGNDIISSFKDMLGNTVEAIALFGSLARDEATDKSDIDLVIVGEFGKAGFLEGHRVAYRALESVRVKYKRDTSVVVSTYEELAKVNSFVVNVAFDGLIFYDATGRITKLFSKVKQALAQKGWERYKTPDGCYGWKLAKPIHFGERITLLPEEEG
nr:nucleotidyltransferase domain-containing protein [Candidatus Njordarchaeota archaeon]